RHRSAAGWPLMPSSGRRRFSRRRCATSPRRCLASRVPLFWLVWGNFSRGAWGRRWAARLFPSRRDSDPRHRPRRALTPSRSWRARRRRDMSWPSVVVKVGGSLYDLPDLATRLRRWLDALAVADVLLVPGGGAAADVIRDLDKRHRLGEEQSHWLALRALTLNAHILAELLPGAGVVHLPRRGSPPTGGPAVLDALAFLRWDEDAHPAQRLPHRWDATSDAVAARVA